jgi:hypothetical protein
MLVTDDPQGDYTLLRTGHGPGRTHQHHHTPTHSPSLWNSCRPGATGQTRDYAPGHGRLEVKRNV